MSSEGESNSAANEFRSLTISEECVSSLPRQRRVIERDAGVNPVARILLAGALLPTNHASPVYQLSGCVHLLEVIFSYVRASWKDALLLGPKKDHPDLTEGNWGPSFGHLDEMTVLELSRTFSIMQLPGVHFPPPSDININMMPIILDDICSIPIEYRHYSGIIEQCRMPQNWLCGTEDVAYLTIHESRVDACEPQRRGGIHAEGFLATAPVAEWWPWGQFNGMNGGIFSASSVSKSARIWNAKVPREKSAALGEGCDLEHLRGVLNETVEWVEPEAGELYWMTDATPHESLPLPAGTYRQYFRLVTGEVAVWWEKHSTKNPLGILPKCRIVTHSKFEDGEA